MQPTIGFTSAVSIRVGNELGAGNPRGAKKAALVAIGCICEFPIIVHIIINLFTLRPEVLCVCVCVRVCMCACVQVTHGIPILMHAHKGENLVVGNYCISIALNEHVHN